MMEKNNSGFEFPMDYMAGNRFNIPLLLAKSKHYYGLNFFCLFQGGAPEKREVDRSYGVFINSERGLFTQQQCYI